MQPKSSDRLFYLDHCGSTPLAPLVRDEILGFLASDIYGNPSADHHQAGRRAADIIDDARQNIASAIGARPENIIFTSGATEANNLALWGFFLRYRGRGCRLIYGATEHKSVIEVAENIATVGGADVLKNPVLPSGSLDLNILEDHLKSGKGRPTLVAIMHINNEIPVRHPINEISQLCHRYGAFFHCDGVQGYVREPVNLNSGSFGSYVFSAHKIYGPRGVGILAIADNQLASRFAPAHRGGDQEYGLRPGTPNTLAIVGAARAVQLHEAERARRVIHMHACAEAFTNALLTNVDYARLTVPIDSCAAGIVNFYIEGLDAPSLLSCVPDICINRGASCIGSGGEHYSHVPMALGCPVEIQANTLRASFGDAVTADDSVAAALRLAEAIHKLNRQPR
jgi:cysteine desulfurase